MPVTAYVVLEEGTFPEKLLKTLQGKTSELEKLKEKRSTHQRRKSDV